MPKQDATLLGVWLRVVTEQLSQLYTSLNSSFEGRLCKSQWTEQFDTFTAFTCHINLLDKQRDTEIFICKVRDIKWLSDNLSDSCFPSALCPLFFSCQFNTVKRCLQPALTLTPGRQLIVTRSQVQHSLTAYNFKVLGANYIAPYKPVTSPWSATTLHLCYFVVFLLLQRQLVLLTWTCLF